MSLQKTVSSTNSLVFQAVTGSSRAGSWIAYKGNHVEANDVSQNKSSFRRSDFDHGGPGAGFGGFESGGIGARFSRVGLLRETLPGFPENPSVRGRRP
jgi:hypothetical protein